MARSDLLISMLGKLDWFCLTSLITLILLISEWMCPFLRKNHLLRCLCWPSLLNWIGTLTLSLLLKMHLRKLEPSSFYEVSFSWGINHHKSTIWSCMEYCCHVWAGAPSCYLELLEKLLKLICRTVSASLAASLEPFGSSSKCGQIKSFL